MLPNAQLANIVLVVTAAVLFYVAVTDLRHYRIRNEFILLLLCLFVLHTMFSGGWLQAAWNFGLAALVFCFLVYWYSRQWMGGGDVKMLTVAFLWIGVECALAFAVLLLLFASLHVVAAKFGLVASHKRCDDGPRRIAFAPSVAAAMIAIFMLRCVSA
jgi:prepilin peptidase CpaA